MNENCEFSRVTRTYINEFERILNNMILNMTEVRFTNSISDNFIIQMIPHHKAAIEMSENLLKYTTCVPLQRIAEGIVEEQTKGIGDMLEIQCKCKRPENSDSELCRYQECMDDIMNAMFLEMGSACTTNQINMNFMREMIPHHLGAVKMSELTLKQDICPELVPVLKSIITSQKKGILQMKQILSGGICRC